MKLRNFFTFFVFSIVMTMRESREQQHTHIIQLSKTVSLLKHKIQKKFPKIKNERRRFLLLSSMDRGTEYWR